MLYTLAEELLSRSLQKQKFHERRCSRQVLLMIARCLHQRGTPRYLNNSNYSIMMLKWFLSIKKATYIKKNPHRKRKIQITEMCTCFAHIHPKARIHGGRPPNPRKVLLNRIYRLINNRHHKKREKQVWRQSSYNEEGLSKIRATHLWITIATIGRFQARKLIIRPAATPHTTSDASWIPQV